MSTKSEHTSNVESPCIRHCCLNEEDICIGCFRHLDEIIAWQELSNEKKQNVIALCNKRKAQCQRL